MRIVTPLAIVGLVLLIAGCGEEEPTGPGPTVSAPTDLTITVVPADSLSVQLSWTAPVVAGPADIDGYIVSFAGNVLDTVTTTFFQHTPTSLGTYSVKAYKGSDESSAIQKSTALHEETGEGPIFYMDDQDPDHPSGYGWDASGNGQTYSVADPANSQFVDLILDEFDNLRSPLDRKGAGWHLTHILVTDSTYANMKVAPTGPYYNLRPAQEGDVYVLQIQSGHYLKLEITTWDAGAHSMRFSFGFQTVAGFRRLG